MLEKRILCKWPISYLQDNLGGISTGDFIVIGCASGGGKSTISRLITRQAAEEGTPAVLYSLENQAGTFTTEMVRDLAFRAGETTSNLRDFALNDTRDPNQYRKFRQEAYLKSQQTTEAGVPLLVVHEAVATNEWTISRLVKQMKAEILKGYRLFIVDHLDVLAPNNELNEIAEVMRQLWSLASEYNLCIIAFSQLGKQSRALCPSQYDLRGNMNKAYKATHVITLGRHDYGYYAPPIRYPGAQPTYIRIAKSRDTALSCAVCYYDRGYYLQDYTEVTCDEYGMFIDGQSRESLQKWKRKQEEHQ